MVSFPNMRISAIFVFDEFLGKDSGNFCDVKRYITSIFVRFEWPAAEVVLL